MKFCGTLPVCIVLLLSLGGTVLAQSPGPTVAPGSMSFAYQVNSITLPAALKLTATLPAASATLGMSVSVASAPQGWLTVTPDAGHSPLALTVTVNPTGLTPGSYTGTITINTVPSGSNPAIVSVTLSVSNPPSLLLVSSTSANYAAPLSGSSLPSLTFSFTTGGAAASPVSSQLDVASSGDIIPFNVTAGASGKSSAANPVWLRVNQSGQLANLQTSGVALSGSFVPITVTLDSSTISSLDPGSYGGLITIAADHAANGTATVLVNLVVSAGPPILRAMAPIFPSNVIAGPTVDPVITVYGDNFFSTSVVAIQLGASPAVTLPSKLLSRKVMQATIKAAYLAVPAGPVAYPIVWVLSVTNPAPPNNPAQTPVTTNFSVTDPAQPAISAVVNAGSYASTSVHVGTAANPVPAGTSSIAPREIISIFGQNLGPIITTTASPSGTPLVYPTSIGTVSVTFRYGSPPVAIDAPLIVSSANQINCVVPSEVSLVLGSASQTVTVQVSSSGLLTSQFPLSVIPEDPGVFTFGGLGQGQAAILNFDTATGSYVINSSKAASPKGSTISIYATVLGEFSPSTPLSNGEVAAGAVTVADNTVRVDIDGQPSVVTYAGSSPGAVAGLVQINAIVPPTVRTGAAIPITVSIGPVIAARRSQQGVTLAVK